MRKYFGRNDVILIIAMVLISLACAAFFTFMAREGSHVLVYVDGNLFGEYDLSDDVTVEIKGYGSGSNRLMIRDGEAFIKEASCKDKLCVHQGRISREGEEIVCLPNRVIVRIEGKGSENYDALTR